MEILKKCNICKAKFLSVNMPSVPKFKQTLRHHWELKMAHILFISVK